MPTNDPRPTKAQRRDEARAKALQMRQQQERRARRTKILTASLLVVVIAAVGVVVGITIKNKAETEAKYSDVVTAAASRRWSRRSSRT